MLGVMLPLCYLFVRCYVRCLRVLNDSNAFNISKLAFPDVRCCEKTAFRLSLAAISLSLAAISVLLAAYSVLMAAY